MPTRPTWLRGPRVNSGRGSRFTLPGPAAAGLSHTLGKRIGSRHAIPHGVSSCLVLPHVMRYLAPRQAPAQARIAEALGVDVREMPVEQAAACASDAVADLIRAWISRTIWPPTASAQPTWKPPRGQWQARPSRSRTWSGSTGQRCNALCVGAGLCPALASGRAMPRPIPFAHDGKVNRPLHQTRPGASRQPAGPARRPDLLGLVPAVGHVRFAVDVGLPLVGAAVVFAAVLWVTPPGFGAIAEVVLGSPRGPSADAAAYVLGAAGSLALVTLLVLAAVSIGIEFALRLRSTGVMGLAAAAKLLKSPTMSTSTLIDEITLGPLSATQRSEIMRHATELGPEVRRVFRRLLILGQTHGLESESIGRAAAQARAHFEI